MNKVIRHLMIDHEPELNLVQLARLVEVSPRFIGMFLGGERKSKPCKKKVAAVLGISTQRLARLLRA